MAFPIRIGEMPDTSPARVAAPFAARHCASSAALAHCRRFDMNCPDTRRRGFTLIELMVVMVLIALLLTLAVPRYFHTIDQGKISVQRQNIATLRDAIDKFHGDTGKYPARLSDLADKHYLREVPLDPVTDHADWVTLGPPDSAEPGIYDVRSAADKDTLPVHGNGAANMPAPAPELSPSGGAAALSPGGPAAGLPAAGVTNGTGAPGSVHAP
jgi:general secretion pathway protein G